MADRRVAVIGAGVSGLAAGAVLARRGFEVDVFEAGERPGGYVTGFRRHGFYFDATGAFLAACGPGGALTRVLEAAGARDEVAFLPIPEIRNVYPGFDLRLDYRSPRAYLEGVAARFPGHREALARYARLTERLGRELLALDEAPGWKRALFPLFFPRILRYARASHARVLGRLFPGAPDLWLALSALPTTLPPSRLSYPFVAVLWAKVLREGVFYPRGGMEALSGALARALARAGGRLHLGARVAGIRLSPDGRRAAGVRLASGGTADADWVVGASNLFAARRLLPGGRHPYGRLHRAKRLRPSASALLFYLGLPSDALPPDWPYFVSIQTDADLERAAAALAEGSMEEGLHVVITTPSLLDPGLAPPGHHSVKVLVHAPPAGRFRHRYGEAAALSRLEDRIFGEIRSLAGVDLRGPARFVERATPMTLERRTGNEEGAMYGLDAAVDQVGPLRPPNRTALDRLLWVGHYTHPSHGIVGSALSGLFAADTITEAAGR
ncbi:NAD(P)/FAD-dependent oxidoreductase [Dissulfurirhabdus thermomarina]|uniref:NAD(P)/FAD-dependent oxidoreductase n=1 Tax=Dissulfurirhabdus thermomarina TaxID=1765737 RepID=A0A6N9TNR7_DISTH|nr:NAD(P)/FAD-dependent oxidoreductase [Dissulfurirhabdus thermomarina]NDY41394.1 NAD(P)/FAD-dependent oxidoreductase [Dissulfurirhabdus thermomarina]NMX23590.1 NAD(P)/FAD-dependent oxidoreductase [Dissulfurirhabdus thermomarina]